MSLDSILNQIKFAGVPAKFSGTGERLVSFATNAIYDPYRFTDNPSYWPDNGFMQNTIAQALRDNGWSDNGRSKVTVVRNDVGISIAISFNVGCHNELNDYGAPLQAIVQDLGYFYSVQPFYLVSIDDNSQCLASDPLPVVNGGNLATVTVHTGTPTQIGTNGVPNPNANPAQNQAQNQPQPKSNWFTDLIMDDSGKLSTAGWGVLAVIGVGIIAVSTQKR